MNRFLVCLLMGLFSLVTQAREPSQLDIRSQKAAQQRCMQLGVKYCIHVCRSSKHSNCSALCRENYKHECRQAGE